MSVVITTYTLASGLMQQGMTWWQAMLTILLGNVDRPRADDPQRARRHEVRRVVSRALPRQLRREGRERAGDPARARRVRLVRHSDVDWRPRAEHAARGGVAGVGGLPGNVWIAFALFWLVQVAIIINGLEGIKKLEELVGAAAARRRRAAARRGRSRRGGGLGHILSESARLQTAHVPFWQLFPAALTANVGYWATLSLNIPDFTRYARSQRSQALGQALGLPATMTAFAFIGVAVTSATIVMFGEAIWDPVALIARIGSVAGDHLRRARRAARAAHDQHGGQRRVAGQRLLEPGAAPHQLRHRRADHRRHRHRR